MSTERKKGSFLWWSSLKGFGLIVADGQKFYAHILHLDQSSGLPRTGDACEFEVSERPKRREQDLPEAINIRVGVRS